MAESKTSWTIKALGKKKATYWWLEYTIFSVQTPSRTSRFWFLNSVIIILSHITNTNTHFAVTMVQMFTKKP